MMEIGKIGWFNYEKALGKFREYDEEKKNVIKNVYKKLKNIKINSINNDRDANEAKESIEEQKCDGEIDDISTQH